MMTRQGDDGIQDAQFHCWPTREEQNEAGEISWLGRVAINRLIDDSSTDRQKIFLILPARQDGGESSERFAW